MVQHKASWSRYLAWVASFESVGEAARTNYTIVKHSCIVRSRNKGKIVGASISGNAPDDQHEWRELVDAFYTKHKWYCICDQHCNDYRILVSGARISREYSHCSSFSWKTARSFCGGSQVNVHAARASISANAPDDKQESSKLVHAF